MREIERDGLDNVRIEISEKKRKKREVCVVPKIHKLELLPKTIVSLEKVKEICFLVVEKTVGQIENSGLGGLVKRRVYRNELSRTRAQDAKLPDLREKRNISKYVPPHFMRIEMTEVFGIVVEIGIF